MRRPALARTAQKHRPPPILSRIGPQPLVAYSAARKLRTGYAGSALRVRRSNDDAELDIGFTASGLLDTAALLAHTGANSGFVTTLYDQSGSANAVQATKANQPRIVSSGVVDTYGGRPCPRYRPAGTETHRLLAAVAIVDTTFSVVAVAALDNATAVNYGRFLGLGLDGTDDSSAAGYWYALRNATNQKIGVGSQTDYSSVLADITYGTPFVMSSVMNGTTSSSRSNGTSLATSPKSKTSTFAISSLSMGAGLAAPSQWGGGIGDVMVFADALGDVDRLAVERDLGAFYGVVVQ